MTRRSPARLSAPGGVYDIDEEVVAVNGELRLRTADGYQMTASGVSFNLESRTMLGEGGVEGAIPAGTFSAATMRTDVDTRRITLDGNARLTLVPGQLRMP